jgi:transcriptional regulator with XRE-family HTH domain
MTSFDDQILPMRRTEAGEDKRFDLGARVRLLRTDRKLSLRELARRTGLAASTLSKIENNQQSVTYDTMVLLCEAMDVRLTDLFSELTRKYGGRRAITRAGKGRRYVTGNYVYELLCADLREKKGVPIFAEVKATSIEEFGELLHHPGEEFVFVLEGRIELHTDLYDPVELGPGDSIYFDSTMSHGLVKIGNDRATVLWVQIP